MIREVKTDFTFKDKRTYINASTQLEELTKVVYGTYYSEEQWRDPKVDAKFHKPVLSNGVFKLSEDPDILTNYYYANSTFRFFDDSKSVSAVFLGNEDLGIVQRTKTSCSVEGIVLQKDFSGLCNIDCSSRMSLVENIIEANKRIHLLTCKHGTSDVKVINLYMRKFPVSLPVIEDIDYGRILLKIENVSSRQLDKSVVTLNSLYFPELKIARFEISFIVEEI